MGIRKGGPGATAAAGNDDDNGLDRGRIKDGPPNAPVPHIVLKWTFQMKYSTILLLYVFDNATTAAHSLILKAV